jgi:TonB family protein
MASSEELAPVLPDTLPEDFKDWDGEVSPPATPVDQKEWEVWESSHSFGKNAKQNWYPAERDATPASSGSSSASGAAVMEPEKKPGDTKGEGRSAATPAKREDWEAWLTSQSPDNLAKPSGPSAAREAIPPYSFEKPNDTSPAPSAQVLVKQKESSGEPANETNGHVAGRLDGGDASNQTQAANQTQVAPGHATAAAVDGLSHAAERVDAQERESDAVLFSAFSAKNIEAIADEKGKKSRRKWIIGSVGVSAVLVAGGFLLVPRFHHGAAPEANQPAQQAAAPTDAETASDAETATDAAKPAAGELSTDNGTAAATGERRTADDKTAGDTDRANLAQARAKAEAQAQMMNDQLNAPAQIPKQVAESGPPPASFGAGDANEMGGSNTNDAIFNGHGQPVVKVVAPKPITISSGVATGMLVSKTAPIYPPIAKSARVSGTVEMHATISKEGAVKDLSVVSGPNMLRGAAFDAVRTWRYKPYKLNNQPTEVETTINVVFTLSG